MSPIIPLSALEFLNNLLLNNNREWFYNYKNEFKIIENQVKNAFNHLGDLMNTHDHIDAIKMFRIYRDVRFSKNKSPYKTHFSAAYHRKKPELRGGYYVQIQPNNQSFIAVGFWDPNKEDLLRIRKEFEIDATEIKAILSSKDFKNTWGNFEGDSLKTAPRGFDKNHPNLELISRKQYIFIKKYTDKEVLSSDFLNEVNKAFIAASPFLNYMSAVLTTNLNGESII